MRVLILIAGVSLALSACNKHDDSSAAQNGSQELSADKIVANDVTAIDAVTGDAANMAADVNYEGLDSIDANTAGNSPVPAKPRSVAKPAKAAKTAPAIANSSADTTATNAN